MGGILFACLHRSPEGGSTLITSAPKSERITAAPGAATKLAKSTTLSPEKMLSVAIGVLLNASVGILHRPWKCDARFSRKADVPSFLSSVPAHSPKYEASSAKPSFWLVSIPLLTASIEDRTATGAL